MFNLIKIEGGRINVFEPQILTVGGAAVKNGEALVLNAGVLEKATGKPTFIALSDCAKDGQVAVGRVEPNQIFETTVTAAPTSLKVGQKVTISDGLAVTATTTSGVAEIVDLCGATKSGDKILVRFS
jgi:hypothetical protein